jgi:hypothetical protein
MFTSQKKAWNIIFTWDLFARPATFALISMSRSQSFIQGTEHVPTGSLDGRILALLCVGREEPDGGAMWGPVSVEFRWFGHTGMMQTGSRLVDLIERMVYGNCNWVYHFLIYE